MVDPGPLAREPIPPWRQIADRVTAAITSGALAPGQKLPSETELRQTYGVARMTVRRALEHLRDEERTVVSRPGIGWFVAEP